MKTIFKFFAAALAIVAAVSCAKDNNSENEPKMVHKVFSASLNEDETSLSAAPDRRTTLHTDGKTVHWTAGDEIALIPSESEVSTNFSIIEDSIDGTFADFEGDAVDADSYRAVYPANAYKSLASTKDVFAFYSGVLAKQYAVAGNFSQNSRTNCPNTNIAVSTTSHDNHLYFENINAFLKFKLNRSDVYSIEISSDAVTYDVEGTLSANADLGSTIKYVASTGHTYLEENVTIEVWGQNGMPLSPDVDYYIAIPAVEIEGLTIKVRGSGLSELFTNKKQSTFKAESNTIYNLGTLVAPPRSAEVGDYFYTDGTYSADYDSSKDLAGIVFYTGDPTASDATLAASEYSGCTHGLVVATEAVCGDSGVVKFCTKEGLWNSNGVYLNTIGVKYESNTVKRNEPYSNYMTGYNNTMALRTYDSASSAIKYCDDMIKVEGTSPWYIPTIAEFDVLYDNYDDVCASLNSLSYISFPKSEYWTVSEEDGTYVGTYKLYSKGVDEKRKSPISGFSSVYILPIFAF